MSIAKAAAKAMLSDALLPDNPGIFRFSHLELELPIDKVIKYVSVGLPLMLVCMAFVREISLGKHSFKVVSQDFVCVPLSYPKFTSAVFFFHKTFIFATFDP